MRDDIDRMMEVMDAAFDPFFNEAWTRRQVLDSLALPTTHYLLSEPAGIANSGGEIAPAAGFLLSRAGSGEEELLLIAVRPEYRRGGIGRQLVENFSAAAKARGAERVFLEMRANNDAAAFYEGLGFSSIGRRRDYYSTANGSRIDAITMMRELIPE